MCNSISGLQVAPSREVLPTNVKPHHYDLVLEPLFDSFTFKGEETIHLDVKDTTTSIELNSLEIDIHEAAVNGTAVKDIKFDTDNQTATFTLAEELAAGTKARLHIKFTGELNDKMAGFYRSSYQDNGETKYLATTQMEPTDCRRAFPSFDEPALKATFDVALIHDPALVALSNEALYKTEQLDSGKAKTYFKTSPIMSTYLVAFVVGDLERTQLQYNDIPVSVLSTPGNKHLHTYSAQVAVDTLGFFEKKFGIPYPLTKLDMVAIHDFSAGAMENFGLITFRTVDLLLDPENTNASVKQRVTEVVMHELAHQWFGNLVTMDFWDGLWLNEGFATWMSWYACDALFPEWKVWESYVSDSLQQALSLDALRSSHPVEVPVKRADEINQIFDAISYSKGSSLLKMISRWLGEDTFIKGVSLYLDRHKWGNTQTSDLWQALGEVSGEDVVGVMDIWTKKVGFPVIKVEEHDQSLTITQHRFLATGDVKDEEDTTLWPVFLGLKTKEGIDESLVLTERSISLPIKDDFFKLNGDQAGLYRTAYSSSRWTKLGKAGVEGKLSVEDRVGLVADAGSLSASGFINTTDLLELVKLWKGETNHVVWDELYGRIASIKGAFAFDDDIIADAINEFILDLISDKLHDFGWEFSKDDSFADQKLRALLYSAAALAKEPNVVAHAKKAFADFVAGDKSAINPNIRGAVFGVAARFGDATTWDQIFHIYRNPASIEEKNAALRALGRFRDSDLLDKTTGLLLQTDIIKQQDIYIPMGGMRSHPLGTTKLWQWVKTHWDELYKLLPPGLSMLGSVVAISTSGFTKLEQKAEIEAFFSNKDTKGYDQGLARSLDIISAKASRAKRDYSSVTKWLSANGYGAAELSRLIAQL